MSTGGFQSQAAGEHGRTPLITDGDERGVALAREPSEPNRDAACEHGRAVEHHEGEGAAAQEDVRAPGRARGIARADHPDTRPFAEVCPVTWRERAGRVDIRDPEPFIDSAFDDAADKGRLPASQCADDLRQSPPWHTFAGEHRVELAHARGQARGIRFGEVENVGELLPESGEGHRKDWCVVRSA